jgi:hypothetical protein
LHTDQVMYQGRAWISQRRICQSLSASAPSTAVDVTHIGRIRPTKLAGAFCVLAASAPRLT